MSENVWCAPLSFGQYIFIRFGSKLYRQIVGIPMGTNCAPLVADLFLFCYERDFMLSLSANNQTDIIEAFNSTSRYLDDLLNIDNPYFEKMVGQIYPTELQLNKANSSDTEAPFLDLNLSITNGIVSSNLYDKRDDFNFEIVNFPSYSLIILTESGARKLLLKLAAIGFLPNLFFVGLLVIFLRKQRVAINGMILISDWASIFAGVQRGSMLGILHFSIFINDIVNNIQSNICLFADRH